MKKNNLLMQNVNKWVFSQLRICRPLPLPSLVLIRFLWMMRRVLNIMKNEINFSSNFYFSSCREKFIENWSDEATKITITRKIKIEKSEIWFFFWFSWFRILHVNLNAFEKKIFDFFQASSPTKKYPGSENFFQGFLDRSRNRLV